MKKILTLTIATLSLVTLAACSGQKSDSDMKKMDDRRQQYDEEGRYEEG